MQPTMGSLMKHLLSEKDALRTLRIPRAVAHLLIKGRRFPRPIPQQHFPYFWNDELELWRAEREEDRL